MEEVMNQIMPYIMIILTAIAGYLATKIKGFIDARIDKENQNKLMDFVRLTVDYVEQIGIELKPEEKFELAKAKVLIWVNQKGITVSEDELEVLIEAFVHNLIKPLEGISVDLKEE